MEERVVNRSSIEQLRLLAYDALYRLGPPADLGWPQFKKIRNWDGKHLVIRHQGNAITLETVS